MEPSYGLVQLKHHLAEGIFKMPTAGSIKIGFSADFLDGQGRLIFPDSGLSVFDSEPHISYEFLSEHRPEYAPSQLAGYDVVIITSKPRVTPDSVRGVERLCAIGRCGVGYDNVDLVACTEHDIAVYITPGAVIQPMAESIVLLVLALSHNLVTKDRMVRDGHWVESTRRLGREPRDRIVGTVGLGNIACEAVRLLRNFGVARFLTFDPYITDVEAADLRVMRVSLEDLLRESDYVLVNCPLNEQTRNLIGERELDFMKPSAFFINTARGASIDQAALIRTLESRAIAGAALMFLRGNPSRPIRLY